MQEGRVTLGPMIERDWPGVHAIYVEGIASRVATFETGVPDWAEWNERHLPVCRLVARDGGTIVGWAALSPVSHRPAYAGVAEVSIYVAEAARSRGVGRTLLSSVIEESERSGIWTLQASVLAMNESGIGLHKACGFREVGFRERVGCIDGMWCDTVLLERRSKAVGARDDECGH